MWYHRIPGRYGSWYQFFLQLDKFSIFSRYSDGPVFKAAVLKVNWTKNRRVRRLKILTMSPDEPYPFLANNFIFWEIMHRYTLCVSIVLAAHIVRRPSHAIASTFLRFLLTLVGHSFRFSQFTTSYSRDMVVLAARGKEPLLNREIRFSIAEKKVRGRSEATQMEQFRLKTW